MQRSELGRMRKNEETFAKANDEIKDAAVRHDVDPVPFLCECSATNCMTIIRLSLDAYRKVREGEGFIVCPGHDDHHVETIVEDHGSYQVVEKFR